ncbi:MAG: ATP-binding protein [Desulfobaccales bacterium]
MAEAGTVIIKEQSRLTSSRKRTAMCYAVKRHVVFWPMVLWWALMFALPPAAAQEQPKPHILILHSYNRGYIWTDKIAAGMDAVLKMDFPGAEIHTEYMDTKRIKEPEHLRNLYHLCRHKYRGIHFAAILVSDDDALQFMLRYQPELWPHTPVVFCGINDYSETQMRGRDDFTGVLEDISIRETLNTALTLHPQARRIYVVNDISTVGQALHAQVLEAAPQLYRPVELVFLENLRIEEIERQAAQLPQDSLMFFLIFFRDKTGRVFSYDESFRLVKAKTRVPIYSLWDMYLGLGIVGGMLTDGYAQGELAAQMAVRILKGAKPAALEVVRQSPNRYMFDYQQMQQFGIDPAQLPAGSGMINRPYSFYRHYRPLIWVVLGFIILQGIVIVILMVNVNTRRRTEGALRESEEKYRLLVKQVPAVVYKGYLDWSLDCFDDKIEKITGYSKADFDSRRVTWLDLIFPEDLESAKKLFAEARRGNRFYVTEHRIRRKNGETCWIESRNQIILNPAGKTEYISGVFFDITARKRLEDQLAQAQKMEAVGLLAGGMAHDFNNLLTAISGYSEIMMLDLSENDPLRRHAEEIMNAAEHGASLTNQLLAFSRKQILQPRVIDFNHIVTDMDKMLRRLIGEDIDLVTCCSEELGLVKADPGQIEHILMNLVVNARDAMPQGGKLTIETADVFLDEAYAQNHVEVIPGPYVMMAVTDNGVGMDADKLARIFEPFFTTKESGKGTGLGLAMVYGIVKQSGGHIWVYSEPGRGTTFKLYFPRVAEGQAPATPRPTRELLKAPGGWETILLVEDDDALRTLMSKALQRYGYQVWEAANGEEALTICEKNNGPIHLLLTDVVMPQMGGGELATRVAQLRPEIKVLFMSGYTTNAIVHHGVLDEGINFVQKPVKVLSLLQRVREILEDRGSLPS